MWIASDGEWVHPNQISVTSSSLVQRVLHITNRPTPYRLPWFREVDRTLDGAGASLHVLFLGRSKTERMWQIRPEEFSGFHNEFLPGLDAPHQEAIEAIDRVKPTVVVLAWAMDFTAFRILRACQARAIPCVVMCGESPWSARAGTWRHLRGLFRRYFYRNATGFITYGDSSTDYLLSCGLAGDRVHTGLNVVDTGFFRTSVEGYRRAGVGAVDADGRPIPSDRFSCHLLFVGYLLAVKGVCETLEALASLDRNDIALHVVGEGPEREEVRRLAATLGIADRVFLHGYKQTSELPRFYAFADALVFPSLWEVFGLVMVEGAASSLPIIASRFAGGTVEVVRDGVNGFVVDPNDREEFSEAIRMIADDRDLRLRMGDASSARAREILTLRESARRYVDALARFVSYIENDSADPIPPIDEVHEEEREIERSGIFDSAGI